MTTASDLFRQTMSQTRDERESIDATTAAFQEAADKRPAQEVLVDPTEGLEPAMSAENETPAVEVGETAPDPAETADASDSRPADSALPDAEVGENAPEVAETPETAPEASETGDLVLMPDGTQLPVEQLIKGHLRETDYTRKTQELAAQRREFDDSRATVVNQTQEGAQRLQNLVQHLEAEMARTQPDPRAMAQLRQHDPAEWAARNAETEQRQKLIAVANQEAAHIQAQQSAIVIPQQRAMLSERVPVFAKDFEAEYKALGEYATSSEGGVLSRDEWDQLVDHRYVTLVWKAQQYDAAARKAPRLPNKLPSGTPKVIRPGVQRDTGDTASAGFATALARQAESGDVSSTADAFKALEGLSQRRAR